MNIPGTRLRGGNHADGIAAARKWREQMKPLFDAIYGPENDQRQGVTPAGHRVLDWLDEATPIWGDNIFAAGNLYTAHQFLGEALKSPGAVTEIDDLVDVATRVIWSIDRILEGKGGRA